MFLQGKHCITTLLTRLRSRNCAFQWGPPLAIVIAMVIVGILPAEAAQTTQMELMGPATVQPLLEEKPHQPGQEVVPRSTAWTLERLVSEAVARHPETAAQRANLEGARAKEDAALWQFFPSPYISAQQSSNGAASIGIKQPIWTGGKLTSNLDAAGSQVASADISIVETQTSVALRVVSAYQSLLQYRGRIEAEREYIRRLEGYADMMRRRVESSVSAKVDQSLVLARLSQARSDLISLEAGERTALVQISELLGRFLETTDIDTTSSDLPPPRQPDSLGEQAVKLNPTLRRIKVDIETAKYLVDQQQSALWPDLSAKAQYDSQWNGSNGLFRRGSSEGAGRLFVFFEYAPGAGLSSLSNIQAAKAKVASLENSYEAARRDLRARVVSDYDDCLNTYNRRQVLNTNVQALREVLESYTRLFHAGKRSWLDVLNAAQELTQIEGVMADTLALYQASAYRLRIHAGAVPWLQEGGSK